MTSVNDKLVVLSDHDAERIKEAEKRLMKLDKKVETQTPKETPSLVILLLFNFFFISRIFFRKFTCAF